MAKFGKRSRRNLVGAHKDLQRLFNEVVKTFDCAVLCGHRNSREQDRAFHEGRSKLRFPNSNHNSLPSLAVDVVPWPIDWEDKNRSHHFAGFVRGMANCMGLEIRWGGDWDGDFNLRDQSFIDLPHFELRE